MGLWFDQYGTLAIIICILAYVTIQLIKSVIVGPAFSILKWAIYRKDYITWYKHRQTYIPVKKRANFSKGKKHEA